MIRLSIMRGRGRGPGGAPWERLPPLLAAAIVVVAAARARARLEGRLPVLMNTCRRQRRHRRRCWHAETGWRARMEGPARAAIKARQGVAFPMMEDITVLDAGMARLGVIPQLQGELPPAPDEAG